MTKVINIDRTTIPTKVRSLLGACYYALGECLCEDIQDDELTEYVEGLREEITATLYPKTERTAIVAKEKH